MNATKQRAGRLGGLATYAKHGQNHMRAIGKRGAAEFWKRYTLKPISTSQYALVNRKTNAIIAIW